MTLLTYEIFEAVVMEKSFQKAAAILNMTPSAVSHAISGMEKEVGFSLFVRGKQETVLTTQGELLLPYVREVLKSEEHLKQAVAEFQGLEKGTAKIGGFNSVCSTWIPQIVKKFNESFPNIRIEIYQGTYEDVEEWIRNGIIDIALISRVSADGIDFTPLYHDRLMCVVPKGTALKNEKYMGVNTPNKYTTGSILLSQKFSYSVVNENYELLETEDIPMLIPPEKFYAAQEAIKKRQCCGK